MKREMRKILKDAKVRKVLTNMSLFKGSNGNVPIDKLKKHNEKIKENRKDRFNDIKDKGVSIATIINQVSNREEKK